VARQNISSGAKWESTVGYSRAVRVGQQVWVAGTTAVNEAGEIVGEGDAGAQAAFIFSKIERALTAAGASMADVVRTRMFITDLAYEEAVGQAHAAVFAEIRPAATMVVISGLVDQRLLVEIEVDACLS
jgi:enamine deaminase RidA (YjgF/YER057c/UK114 family)